MTDWNANAKFSSVLDHFPELKKIMRTEEYYGKYVLIREDTWEVIGCEVTAQDVLIAQKREFKDNGIPCVVRWIPSAGDDFRW